jgi:hypothetical protein
MCRTRRYGCVNKYIMKNQIKLLLAFTLSLAIVLTNSSCSRTIEDRLPGDWNYTELGTRTVTSDERTVTEDVNNSGTATFIDDGTGSITIGSAISTITWEIVSDTILITEEGKQINYFVTTNEKTLQEWDAEYTELGVDFTFTTESKVTLTQ